MFVAEFLMGSLAFIFRESLRHTLKEELQNGLRHHYNITASGPNSLIAIWDNLQKQVRTGYNNILSYLCGNDYFSYSSGAVV